MARASTPTILSLDRFARIMGVIPPHFNQGTAGVLFSASTCNDIWYQHSWQDADKVSREDLAQEINAVEEELAAFVGYNPGPKFTVEEMHTYPRYLRREYWQSDMGNVRYAPKSVTLKHGKFIGPGRRAVGLIGTATVAGGTLVYTDSDADGFVETVTITLPTTLTDVNEIHAFFPTYGAAPDWEIRPERTKTIAGGVLTMTFYTWQFVDPDLWEAFPPADGLDPVDLTLPGNVLASVEVYRVIRDNTQVSAQFLWTPDGGCTTCGGTGCTQCTYDAVDGCLYSRDPIVGIVIPAPAAYDANTGSWGTTTVDACRDPDMVKVWYESGEIDDRYLAGFTHDPLSDRWARIIAFMTVARLERPFCTCGNVAALAEWLRVDLAHTEEGGGSRFTTEDVINSPFGTHRGEVMAWMQLKKLKDKVMKGVAI